MLYITGMQTTITYPGDRLSNQMTPGKTQLPPDTHSCGCVLLQVPVPMKQYTLAI